LGLFLFHIFTGWQHHVVQVELVLNFVSIALKKKSFFLHTWMPNPLFAKSNGACNVNNVGGTSCVS